MEAPKHILIVDDEKELVAFLRSLFASRGYRVSSALDGEEGMRQLRSGDPDLLILDMNMPRMGGVEFYTRICTHYGRSRFPVLVLTAIEGLSDFFEEALVDAFVTKPFQVADLLGKVDELVSGGGRPEILLAADETPLASELERVLNEDGPRA